MTMNVLLDALGWAVIHSIWQGAAIGGVVFLLLQATRRRSTSIRCATSFLGLLGMLAAFAATTFFLAMDGAPTEPAGTMPTAVRVGPAVGIAPTSREVAASPPAAGAPDRSLDSIPGGVAWLWLAGVGVMSTRLIGQWRWSRRLRNRGTTPVDAKWLEIFDTLKTRCGVGERVRLLVSRTVDSPMVVGWLHPVVLLPASTFTSLSPDQLRAILAHELLHLARRDHLLNMVQSMVEVALFFHPVTWWLSRQVRIERELDCDDATLQVADSPRSLAEALLAIESLRTTDTRRASIGLAATGGSLMHRITRLTSPNRDRNAQAGWRLLSTCSILAIAGAAVATTSLDSTAQARQDAPSARAEARSSDELAELRAGIEERLRAMGMQLREQVAAGEMTDTEARERFQAAEERMWNRFRMAEENAAGRDRGDDRGEERDLDLLKARIEAQIKANGEELAAMVEAGKISEAAAKERYADLERRLWMRYRAAEEGGMPRDVEEDRDIDLEELKASIEARLKTLGAELRKQVAAGDMTAEEAKAKYDAAEEQMWRRFRMAEENAGGRERDDNRDLEELKASIEARLKALGAELRKQVAAGDMTAEEAKAKYDEAEEGLWRRFRMAEENAGGRERGDNRDLEELEAQIEERLRAMGMKLREQVAAGEMTGEEAREKYADAEERLWRRFRMAEENADERERERGEERDLDELEAQIEERLRAMGAKLREQVAAGEMTGEEAREKYADAEERLWRRFRMAEDKAAADD